MDLVLVRVLPPERGDGGAGQRVVAGIERPADGLKNGSSVLRHDEELELAMRVPQGRLRRGSAEELEVGVGGADERKISPVGRDTQAHLPELEVRTEKASARGAEWRKRRAARKTALLGNPFLRGGTSVVSFEGGAGKVEGESRDDPPEGVENLDRRAQRRDRQIRGDPNRESEILATEVAERPLLVHPIHVPGGFEEGRPTCARVLQHCRSDRALDEIPDGYPLEPGDPRIESRDGKEEERERHPPAHRARAQQTERRERESREEDHVSVSTARERPESNREGEKVPDRSWGTVSLVQKAISHERCREEERDETELHRGARNVDARERYLGEIEARVEPCVEHHGLDADEGRERECRAQGAGAPIGSRQEPGADEKRSRRGEKLRRGPGETEKEGGRVVRRVVEIEAETERNAGSAENESKRDDRGEEEEDARSFRRKGDESRPRRRHQRERRGHEKAALPFESLAFRGLGFEGGDSEELVTGRAQTKEEARAFLGPHPIGIALALEDRALRRALVVGGKEMGLELSTGPGREGVVVPQIPVLESAIRRERNLDRHETFSLREGLDGDEGRFRRAPEHRQCFPGDAPLAREEPVERTIFSRPGKRTE